MGSQLTGKRLYDQLLKTAAAAAPTPRTEAAIPEIENILVLPSNNQDDKVLGVNLGINFGKESSVRVFASVEIGSRTHVTGEGDEQKETTVFHLFKTSPSRLPGRFVKLAPDDPTRNLRTSVGLVSVYVQKPDDADRTYLMNQVPAEGALWSIATTIVNNLDVKAYESLKRIGMIHTVQDRDHNIDREYLLLDLATLDIPLFVFLRMGRNGKIDTTCYRQDWWSFSQNAEAVHTGNDGRTTTNFRGGPTTNNYRARQVLDRLMKNVYEMPSAEEGFNTIGEHLNSFTDSTKAETAKELTSQKPAIPGRVPVGQGETSGSTNRRPQVNF